MCFPVETSDLIEVLLFALVKQDYILNFSGLSS